ncbi:hypothetical protein M0804_013056 [Polistes exclamans]|nr:hypothetical protein M0804_013056 [Polistes exclamans]
MLVSLGGLGKAEGRFRVQCSSMPGKLAAALSVTPVSPTLGAKSMIGAKRGTHHTPYNTIQHHTIPYRIKFNAEDSLCFKFCCYTVGASAGASASAGLVLVHGAAAAVVTTTTTITTTTITASSATAAARVFAVHSKPVPNELT